MTPIQEQGYLTIRDFVSPIVVSQFKFWAMNPDNIHRGNAVDGKYYADHDGSREYNVWWTTQPPIEMWLPIVHLLTPKISLFFPEHEWDVHAVDCITTRPGSSKMFAHIDTPYKWEEFRTMNEFLGLQIIIPLDHFTIQNGATMFWPGSHMHEFKHEELISNISKYNELLTNNGQQFLSNPGDVLMYDGRVLHSTMPNKSSDHRSALLINILRLDIIDRIQELDDNTDYVNKR